MWGWNKYGKCVQAENNILITKSWDEYHRKENS